MWYFVNVFNYLQHYIHLLYCLLTFNAEAHLISNMFQFP